MERCDEEEEGKQVERMESDSEKYADMANEFSDNREIYINPKIYKTKSESTQNDTEGCLSVPNLTLDVIRYDKIKERKSKRGHFVIRVGHLVSDLMNIDNPKIIEYDHNGFRTE